MNQALALVDSFRADTIYCKKSLHENPTKSIQKYPDNLRLYNQHLCYTDYLNIFARTHNIKPMDAKLTLKLDKAVIDKAKDYASSQKRSLSRLIESYLKSLVDTDNIETKDDIEISPFVKSLQTGVKIPADFDYKEAYSDYLAEKHK